MHEVGSGEKYNKINRLVSSKLFNEKKTLKKLLASEFRINYAQNNTNQSNEIMNVTYSSGNVIEGL